MTSSTDVPLTFCTPITLMLREFSRVPTQSRNTTKRVPNPASKATLETAGVIMAPRSVCIFVAHCEMMAIRTSLEAASFCRAVMMNCIDCKRRAAALGPDKPLVRHQVFEKLDSAQIEKVINLPLTFFLGSAFRGYA